MTKVTANTFLTPTASRRRPVVLMRTGIVGSSTAAVGPVRRRALRRNATDGRVVSTAAAAQNHTRRSWPDRARTGDLCVERHERTCALRCSDPFTKCDIRCACYGASRTGMYEGAGLVKPCGLFASGRGGRLGRDRNVAAVVDAWVLLGCRPACCGCSRQCARRDEAWSVGRLGCRGMYPC
jgi:hypothetical protein